MRIIEGRRPGDGIAGTSRLHPRGTVRSWWAVAIVFAVILLAAPSADAATSILTPGGVYTHTLSQDADGGPWVAQLKLVASADGGSIAGIEIGLSCAGGSGGAGWFQAALPIPIRVDPLDAGMHRGQFEAVDPSVDWALTGEIEPTVGGGISFLVSIAKQSGDSAIFCYVDSGGTSRYFNNASWTWEAPTSPTPPSCSITGTEGADLLRGTDGPDVICGLGGDDRIAGLAGDDVIVGGAGNDRIRGNEGNDDLRGGAGRDTITGEAGDDQLDGGDDDDRLDGKAGVDTVHGGAGGDLVIGGYDNDSLYGDDGDDVLMDGAGRNSFSGDAGDDWLYARNSKREMVDCGAGFDRYQVDTTRPDLTSGCERRLTILATPHSTPRPPARARADVSEDDVVTYSGHAPSYWAHNGDNRIWLGITKDSCLNDGSGAGSAATHESFGGGLVGLWASVRDRDVGRQKWVRFEYKKQIWSQQGWSTDAPYGWHDGLGDDVTTTSGRARGFRPRWKQERTLAWLEAGALHRVLVRVSWFHDVFGPDRIARTPWINVLQCRAQDSD